MSSSRVKRSIAIAATAMLGLSVAIPAIAVQVVSSSREVELQTGERVLHVYVSRDEVSGPGILLRRVGSGFQGRANGLNVRLFWEIDRVVGQVGPDEVHLQIKPVLQGVEVQGTYAGGESDLHVWPTTLSGTIGYCRYDLALAGDRYSGWRSCGTPLPVATTLRLPATMAPLGQGERVTILAILLSRA